jgi:hypothetical protein
VKLGGHFWQPRYYDFNVWSEKKRIEKLRHIHRNPMSPALLVLAFWGEIHISCGQNELAGQLWHKCPKRCCVWGESRQAAYPMERHAERSEEAALSFILNDMSG